MGGWGGGEVRGFFTDLPSYQVSFFMLEKGLKMLKILAANGAQEKREGGISGGLGIFF